MTFTDRLWKRIEPIYEATLAHPFIRELTDGTLPRDTFLFYLKQDTLYLSDFTRALALAGARAADNAHMQSFLEFAVGAIAVERQLHEDFYAKYDTQLDVVKAPACFTYTHFLLSKALLGSYAGLIGAVLPCFWIYREVGMAIYRRAAPDNPYRAWIDTYAGEAFNRSVERAIEIADEVAGAASEAQRKEMEEAFVHSTLLEWMFWDSAYRREAWPLQEAMTSVPAS
ncbi:MAG: aminopyrimidine aminohydrolase [Rhodothermaceae bacterium]|nr:MAG: aminopyrimidine aminohydrolase [Rhodothermaceae bacterium]